MVNRVAVKSLRSPFTHFAIFGIAIFTSHLLAAIFAGIGWTRQIDFSDMVSVQQQIRTWWGFCFYAIIDYYAYPYFALIIILPIIKKVYYREVGSGMYSVHVFYFSYFLIDQTSLILYPIISLSLMFRHLELAD